MPRRRSHQTRLILQVLLDAPSEQFYGLEIVRASGVGVGTAYAILRRLEDEGLIDGSWEDSSPSAEGRPRRRYYRLNSAGKRVAIAETDQQQIALRQLMPGWSPS
jgi:PadR family transcriptional regulator PadR